MQSEKSNNQTKHVTNRNGMQLAKFAREFGLPRKNFVDFINNPEKRTKFFKELMGIGSWFENLQLEAKKINARIHLIPKLIVDYNRSHNDAAFTGGPNTKQHYDVLRATDKYQLLEKKKTTETIILLNWTNGGGNYEKAVEWGLQNNLHKTNPHIAFALGEQFPKLEYDIGPNPMYVVETTGCMFNDRPSACCVRWRYDERLSGLDPQSSFGVDEDWFIFSK